MDDDDLHRESQLTIKYFEEDVAVLADDSLLDFAFKFIVDVVNRVLPNRILVAVGELTKAIGTKGLVADGGDGDGDGEFQILG